MRDGAWFAASPPFLSGPLPANWADPGGLHGFSVFIPLAAVISPAGAAAGQVRQRRNFAAVGAFASGDSPATVFGRFAGHVGSLPKPPQHDQEKRQPQNRQRDRSVPAVAEPKSHCSPAGLRLALLPISSFPLCDSECIASASHPDRTFRPLRKRAGYDRLARMNPSSC